MSTSFSLSRLGKLITKQFFENTKFYSYSLLALLGLLSLVFAFYVKTSGPNYREEGTYIIFLFGLFITGSVFASMSFDMLGSKDKGIYWLSIPATHLEKLICTIFYTTIVFTAAYCLCFFVVKWLAVMFIQGLMHDSPLITYTKMGGFDKGFGEVIPYFICAYFAVQAFYLLGSVYFSRYTFVITTVAGALVCFAFAYYITRIQNGMFSNNDWELVSVKQFKGDLKDGYLLYSVSPLISNTIKFIVLFAWAPLFWIVTWFRLKEKEI
jgi:hypothetical protein